MGLLDITELTQVTIVHWIFMQTVGLSVVVGHPGTVPECPSKYGTWNTNKCLRNERTSETSVKTFFIEGCGDIVLPKSVGKKKHICSQAASKPKHV